jgi:hypothetical protein
MTKQIPTAAPTRDPVTKNVPLRSGLRGGTTGDGSSRVDNVVPYTVLGPFLDKR